MWHLHPPDNSVYFKDENGTTVLQKLRKDISKYSNPGKILIIGDLNSRVGHSIEQLSHISESNTNEEILESIDIPSNTLLDGNTNSSGKKLMQIMNDTNLICCNGRKMRDTIGKLTCHEYDGSSTVDLALCSWDFYDQIQYFQALDPVLYSDHCPTKLTLQTENFSNEEPVDMEQFEGLFEHYIWITKGAEKFKHELELKETQNRFEKEVLQFCDGRYYNYADLPQWFLKIF